MSSIKADDVSIDDAVSTARSALVIETFDQWSNPPQASASVCWCRVGIVEEAAA